MSAFFEDLTTVELREARPPNAGVREERHLSVLVGLGRDLVTALDIGDVAARVLPRLTELTGALRGLMILDTEHAAWEVVKGLDAAGEPLEPEDLKVNRRLVDDLLGSGKPWVLWSATGQAQTLIVPLENSRGRFGALYVDRLGESSPFEQDAIVMARLVAIQASQAIELQRHEEDRRRAERVSLENDFLRRLNRKQVEQARIVEGLNLELEATSTFLKSVLHSSTEYAIIALDRKGRITTFNAGAHLIYGWERQEVESLHSLSVLLHPEERDSGVLDQMMECATGPTGRFVGETTRLRRDATAFPVQVTLTAIRDSEGRVTGYLDISRDITRYQEMRRQLLFSEKMAGIGTLAAGVAHEFNNLLQGIMGFLSHALENDDRALSRRAMEVSLDAAGRAAILTGRLQSFARPNVGGLAPTGLAELVEETLALVERSFESEGVEIVRQFEADAPPAMVDRSRISQVLLNLLTNARHAVARSEVRRVTVSVRRDGEDRVAVAVEDTGCGIPKELQRRVFEPFFTTKGALGGKVYDGKVHGTGLGLAISSGIVTEHGGSLDLESREGVGTKFLLLLRKAPADGLLPSLGVAPRDSEFGADVRGMKVLVVDDEDLIRTLLSDVLTGRGHDVVRAGDGHEGLVLFGEKGPFDVVVADYQMPRMDGGRFFREIRSRSPQGCVPRRILITGRLEEGDPGECDSILRKPFGAGAIIEAVERGVPKVVVDGTTRT